MTDRHRNPITQFVFFRSTLFIAFRPPRWLLAGSPATAAIFGFQAWTCQSYVAPFRITFESEGKSLILQKIETHLQKKRVLCDTLSLRDPYARRKTGSHSPPLRRF